MSLPFELNNCLKTLPVYQPGRPIEEVARELGMPAEGIVKMASNENPLGPSPLAMAAIQKTIGQLHFYPDGNAFYLKDKMARKLAVPLDHLAFGSGSNEILELIGHVLLGPGDDVVVSQYCFAVYPIVTALFGARLIVVPAKNYGHDLAAMARAITPKTRVVFVANPNNPTGTLASQAEVLAFIQAVPAKVLLAMDEAYFEFLEKPFDLLPLVREGRHPNLLLVRTF
jgi:histidinol-phosphate aminotransferase